MPVPDHIGVVLGWRTWVVTDHGELRSVVVPTTWPARRALDARCNVGPGCAPGSSPGPLCNCGIHAANTAGRAMDLALHHAKTPRARIVLGRVSLWGRIEEHEAGWRAERAYPAVLFVDPGLPAATRARIAQRYGVPVEVRSNIVDGVLRQHARAQATAWLVSGLLAVPAILPALRIPEIILVSGTLPPFAWWLLRTWLCDARRTRALASRLLIAP